MSGPRLSCLGNILQESVTLTCTRALQIQGVFGGALQAIAPSYLTERFPTEVRTTASDFGAVIGGFVTPVASYFAVEQHVAFAVPMLIRHSGRQFERRHRIADQPRDQRQSLRCRVDVATSSCLPNAMPLQRIVRIAAQPAAFAER